MEPRPPLHRFALLFVMSVLLAVAAACSGGDDDADRVTDEETDSSSVESGVDAGASTATAGETVADDPTPVPVPVPTEVAAPPARVPSEVVEAGATGDGLITPLGNAPTPEGWTETEYLFGGEATSYRSVGDLTEDGVWTAEEDTAAPYQTRMIVRTPPAAAFSGVVFVEWFNVTAGTDNSVDWGYVSQEMARSGHAYVGVSVQSVGVNGVEETRLEEGLIDTRGLIVRDPVRYGTLVHPGDRFAFDIFSQAGALVGGLGEADAGVLGGLEATHVIAMGESQSAAFLTTYINAIAPLSQVYDGFLVHSRGGGAPDPAADRAAFDGTVRFRTDLDAPTFVYETETDLNVLGYARARQDDSPSVHTWEVAGTAHADAWSLAISGGPALEADASLGVFIGCQTPINDGPQHETLQAALRHVVAWVVDGTTPPSSPRIEVEGLDGPPDGDLTVVRDENGIAVGGVRTPPVDAPIRTLSGDPTSEDAGFCFLFGQTQPIEPAVLVERYVDAAGYRAELEAAATASVEAGWLLPEDAADVIAEEAARALELGLS